MINQNLFTDVLNSVENQLQNSEFGTGTTAPTTSDTDLETPIAGTNSAVDRIVKGSTYIQAICKLATTEANGNDITEAALKDGADELKSRVVFEAQTKTSDISFDFIYGLTLSQTNL